MSLHSEPRRRKRRQGPATLRGKAIPKTTTDQRLLDRRGPSDWVHTDPWRVLRIQAEFVEGFGLLAELGLAVSVFGSSRAVPGTSEYELAERISAGLAEAGYAVITGGGPGYRASAGAGPERLCRDRHRVPLLLRPQDHVRQVLTGVRGAAGRVRHPG